MIIKRLFWKGVCFFLYFFICFFSYSQTEIKRQGFDGTAADNLLITSSPFAANSTTFFASGPNSRRLTGTGIDYSPNISFENVNVSLYQNIQVSIAFAAQNVDDNEDLFIEYSFNNGVSYTPIQLVDGNNGGAGQTFNFGTGDAAPGQSVNPYTFTIPGVNNTLRLRVRAIGMENDDFYYVDDIIIRGTPITDINVQGNAITIPTGSTATSLTNNTDFGSADVNTGTVAKTFTIQNVGLANLNLGSITSNSADFGITSISSSTVIPSDFATLTVTFNPTIAGNRTAIISIPSNDWDETTYTFTVKGTGTEQEIDVFGNNIAIVSGTTATSLINNTEFGNVANTKTFEIRNTGTSNLNISTITASTTEFSITSSLSTILPGQVGTFSVNFNPTSAGIKIATVTITNNDNNEGNYTFNVRGDAQREINVQGNGITIPSGSTLISSTINTSFGNVDFVSGSLSQTFSIQNLGLSALTISSFSSSNPDFTIALTPSTIGANGSGSLTITFNPSVLGIISSTITLNSNDTDESIYTFLVQGVGAEQEINITGNGNTILTGDATPSENDHTYFGATYIGNGSISRTFTIENTGTATLTLSTPTQFGGNSGDFSFTTLPSLSVAPGSSTTFTITYNPSATLGFRERQISIISNDTSENQYVFTIQIFVASTISPEINVTGNFVSIANNETITIPENQSDFGTVSVNSSAATVSYTIENLGATNLSITGAQITGANASDFYLTIVPGFSIIGGRTNVVQVTFNPLATGVKNATLTIFNNDSDESNYTFNISGTGIQILDDYDNDGDGVTEKNDMDDDNDGITDAIEQNTCLSLPGSFISEYVFLNETFGRGTSTGTINVNTAISTTAMCFENGVVEPNTPSCPSQSVRFVDDGEYTVTHKIRGATLADPVNIHGGLNWSNIEDHTPNDAYGRMAVFNASFAPQVFYETMVTGIVPNAPITYSFWAANIMSGPFYTGTILPNITVDFLNSSNVIIATYNTGNIGRCGTDTADNTCGLSNWIEYRTSVNLGNIDTFKIRFRNNATGGSGNDIALDDIKITQEYCDRDDDEIGDIFDLDADNDGISDVEESGFKNLSNGLSKIDITNPTTWIDSNANGLHDSIESLISGSRYSIPDFDNDGVNDYLDLDSDNDALFDIDEAGLLNGDGDINGDGKGDLLDADRDGILDLHDNNSGYGTNLRSYATDSDSNGQPDYLQLDANLDGVFDIDETLYESFDANNNGILDGTADVDKDGILDIFDTQTTQLGSPRNLERKLFLDFDGRNDYGSAPQVLNNLTQSTMMAWIKLDDTFSSNGFIMGENNFNLKINTTSGIKLQTEANGVLVFSNSNLDKNRWYHVAAIYDATATEKLKLFLNGQKVGFSNHSSLNGNLQNSTTLFTLGKNAAFNTDFYKGALDEVRVFNEALTELALQKMIYQEIKQNGAAIEGEIIPRIIENTNWSNLVYYYKMDNFKDDVIDNHTSGIIDDATTVNKARIFNHKKITYQLAPLPFTTTQDGAVTNAVSQNNFVNGNDVLENDYTILWIKNNNTLSNSEVSLGTIIDSGKSLNVTNDQLLQNNWYVKLDGKLDLHGQSQFIQSIDSELDANSAGFLERDQKGEANLYNYNYWSSPVGTINTTTNNANYNVSGVLKDGTTTVPQNINWTTSYDGSPTSPITLSNYWIFKFQNQNGVYANWSPILESGMLNAGQGFTLKGSGSSLANQNYTFVGKPNNGIIENAVAPNNLNLSGNPYASALDAHAFIADNIDATTGTLFFWEHYATNNSHVLLQYEGGYAALNLVGGIPPVAPAGISGLGSSAKTPQRFIPVGQGFFVYGNSTGGTIQFSNSQRAFVKENDSNSFTNFRTTNQTQTENFTKLRLGITSALNHKRELLLGFMNEYATENIDTGFDAKLFDEKSNDAYFLHSSGLKLGIQGTSNFNNNLIYPLGVKVTNAGVVKFSLENTEHFDGNSAFIYDNLTHQYHAINNATFEINLEAGIHNNRFSLRFTESVLSNENSNFENDIIVATDENTITIYNKNQSVEINSVSLFSITGQMISFQKTNELREEITISKNQLSTGIYIVKLETNKGKVSKKIILQ